MKGKLYGWLESLEYLPEFMRDFHDQKRLFKSIHYLYRNSESAHRVPNWSDGHVYVIDWFLWYMASRGYTLQKSRNKVDFKELDNWDDLKFPELTFLPDKDKDEQ